MKQHNTAYTKPNGETESGTFFRATDAKRWMEERPGKKNIAPDIRNLDAQFRRAFDVLFAPAIKMTARLVLEQFNRDMQDIVEAERANRNIEYAQALIDNAQ